MYKALLFDLAEQGTPIFVFGYPNDVVKFYNDTIANQQIDNFIEYNPGDDSELNKVIVDVVGSWRYLEVHNLLET
jgi:hypothetical protein